MHRSRSTILAVLTVMTLSLAACGGGSGDAPAGDGGDDGGGSDTGETVSLSGGTFTPSALTIPAGTTATFTDGAGHTVTEGSNGSPVDDLIVDESWSGEPIIVSFEEPGTYDITCKIHPGMNMTVTVEG